MLDSERLPDFNGAALFAGRAGRAWFGTTKARVVRTTNYGAKWSVSWTHLTTDSLGVVSLIFRDKSHGLAFSAHAEKATDTLIAVTSDGGSSWAPAALQPLMSSIAGAAFVPDLQGPTLVVVGREGATYSRDNGFSWVRLDSVPYTSVSFARRNAGWAVGESGRVTKISF